MLKIKLFIFVLFFLSLLNLYGYFGSVNAQGNGNYFFYGNGCPHCATVERYFEDNQIFETYRIEKKEIYSNGENANLYLKLMEEKGIPSNQQGVPTLVFEGEVIVGDKPIIAKFETPSSVSATQPVENQENMDGSENFLFQNITLVAVIGASLVDAINPCAFAVLIILMSAVLSTKDPKKALKAGLFFASSIFISYFLMGLGLYSVLGTGNLSEIFYRAVGWIAIILGIFNLKDYFWYGKGFIMEVPLAWRPKMKSLINSVSSPVGAFGIGFIVSLFLLPCTSGPYIVILGMLAKDTFQLQAILYLFLYNLIFITPMILISFAVYKGYDTTKAEEIRQKRLRTLHLIAGIIMLLMGLAIVSGWF